MKGRGTGTRGGSNTAETLVSALPWLLHAGTDPGIFKFSKRTAALANSSGVLRLSLCACEEAKAVFEEEAGLNAAS